MKKHSMPDMKEGGVNVTPLIDIVMVMIVFFMLVAKIGVSRGEDESIPLPSALMGKSLDSLSNTWTLNVKKSAGDEPLITAQVADKETKALIKKELHISKRYASGTDQELERVLADFHRENGEKSNIILRADRDLPYSQLEQVLIAIANNGIGNVSYETKSGEDEPAAPAAGAGG
jgi:biopolymer transport protein ExbD